MNAKPVVIYDGSCGLCAGNLKWLYRLDWLHQFEAAPYQDSSLYSRFPQLKPEECEKALQVVFPNGRIFSGADAFRVIFLRMPLTFLVGLLMRIPPLPSLLRRLYPILAKNRYRWGGKCEIPSHLNSGIKRKTS